MKPDIVAPGVNIRSLSNTSLDGYLSLSGTSMATPLVSGSVALLLNKYGNLSLEEVRKKLVSSCIDLKDSKEKQGAGMLNLKLLFDDKNQSNVLCESIDANSRNKDSFETLLFLLLVLFLLDSRI